MDCAENSGHETPTTGTARTGFETEADAASALHNALMDQVELDRESAKKKCSDRQCEAGECVTIFPGRTLTAIRESVFSYRKPETENGIGYGYEWQGAPVTSACRCVVDFIGTRVQGTQSRR